MSWLIIAGMSAITFINRYAFFAQVVRYKPGAKVSRFLSYSSFAILTSIWTPIVFTLDYSSGFSHAGWDYLLAGSLAAVLSIARIKSLYVVILSATLFFSLRHYAGGL